MKPSEALKSLLDLLYKLQIEHEETVRKLWATETKMEQVREQIKKTGHKF